MQSRQREAAANEGGESSASDRAFFRVRTEVPLRMEPLAASEYDRAAGRILSRIDPELPELDPGLIGWLDRIERKLDRALVMLERPDGAPPTEWGRTTVLSGSGLSFVTEQALETDDMLLLELELPDTPVRNVECIGRVVERIATDDMSEAEASERGVVFEVMRLVDRDAVVRHTLEVQRQQIRGSGRSRDSS